MAEQRAIEITFEGKKYFLTPEVIEKAKSILYTFISPEDLDEMGNNEFDKRCFYFILGYSSALKELKSQISNLY